MKAATIAIVLFLALCAAPAFAQAPQAGTGAAEQAPALPARPAAVEEYRIGPNDLLEIRVFELQQLDRTVRVAREGTISLPLLGEIKVGGLTPRHAEEAIARELRDRNLVKDPQVSVFVKEFISRRVFVQGAVYKPGIVDLLGERTLLDVIGEAGGLNDRAGKSIFIVRPFGKDGEEERIQVDAERLVYQGDPAANVVVQPGDSILVPYQQVFHVYVNGAVSKPGPVEFKSGEPITVLQAVTAAGGGNDRANEGRVQVIRRHADGTKQLFKVNLKRIKRGRDEDLLLQRDDIVVVPESFF